jgi:DNA mismatch repair ATPase MutS
LVETSEDPLLERCKSLLWEILKGAVLSDQIVEEATRLLTKEVKEFEHKYSDLVRSTKLAKQLVKRVLYQVALRYPFMKRNVATIGSRLDISNGEKDE